MNELKTIKLNELNTDETTKELLTGLLNANFNIYFDLITDNYITKDKKLSNWFHYEKDGIFAYYGGSASYDLLKETSTVHKPNKKTGSGWQVLEKSTITLDDLLFTYQRSCDNINKGKEQKFDKLADDLKFWDVIQVIKG